MEYKKLCISLPKPVYDMVKDESEETMKTISATISQIILRSRKKA